MNRAVFFIVLPIILPGSFVREGNASELQHWNVAGVEREALIVTPAQPTKNKLPLLFVFHGHGGSMRSAERGQAFHESWPDAVVVYPQGLPTAGFLGDSRGMLPGWQHNPGENDDRDLKFVDAMIETLRAKYAIDNNRIYATGFSNGGFFLLPAVGRATTDNRCSCAGSSEFGSIDPIENAQTCIHLRRKK